MLKRLSQRLKQALSSPELLELEPQFDTDNLELPVTPVCDTPEAITDVRSHSHLPFPIVIQEDEEEMEWAYCLVTRPDMTQFLMPVHLLLDGPTIALAGGRDFGDWKLLWELCQLLPPDANYIITGDEEFISEAANACLDSRLNYEIAPPPEQDQDAFFTKLIGRADSLIDFIQIGSIEGNFLRQYAQLKKKLRLTVPPGADWIEYNSRKAALEEEKPWLDDRALWEPAPERNEANLGQ